MISGAVVDVAVVRDLEVVFFDTCVSVMLCLLASCCIRSVFKDTKMRSQAKSLVRRR